MGYQFLFNNSYKISKKIFLPLHFIFFLNYLFLTAACEPQWTGFGSSCYRLYTSYQNWNDAKKNCQSFGAELVKIETEEENQFIKREYLKNFRRHYWIGLSDLDNKNDWRWTDGTGLAGYKRWGKGQPNNFGNNQHCVAILKDNNYFGSSYDGEWNDDFCRRLLEHICEK